MNTMRLLSMMPSFVRPGITLYSSSRLWEANALFSSGGAICAAAKLERKSFYSHDILAITTSRGTNVAVRFDRNIDGQAPREFSDKLSTMGQMSPSPSALRLQYMPVSAVAAHPSILAQIDFGSAQPVSASHPYANVALRPLGGEPICELWTSELPVTHGRQGDLHYALNDEFLFGVVSDLSDVNSPDFERRVSAIYESIFSLVESKGYPHLLRVWNYFPDINVDFERLENYQRFCRARSLAFQNRYPDFVHRLPSASAIGTFGGASVVYFIASRSPGVHRENPRQLSAYSYPPQYGPRSPSFARATLKRSGAGEIFFISGTASIVGHASLHVDDVSAQADEALHNVEALLDSTGRDEAAQFRGMQDLDNLKVYIRHPSDLGAVQAVVRRRMRHDARVLYLQGDICRAELLVEVEATLSRY
jgi:chorismate lyase/3-hydroxybenzoate synthase